MVERRIRFAKDKQDIIRKFLSSDDGTGPFKIQADVIAFSAALGAARGRREPLPEVLAEPIRQDVFDFAGDVSDIEWVKVVDCVAIDFG